MKDFITEENYIIIIFIILSTIIFVVVGRPVKLLVWAGALNGLILPLTLGTILLAAHRKHITGNYIHPLPLTIFGLLVVLIMAAMGGYTLLTQLLELVG